MSPRAWIGRSAEAAASWSEALVQAGWEARALPLIRIQELELDADGKELLRGAARFSWAFFASARGVELFHRRLAELRGGSSLSWPPGLHTAAVGPATCQALRTLGAEPDLVGEEGGAELAQAFLDRGEPRSARLLVVAARHGRAELREALAAAGHELAVLELYESLACDGPPPAAGEPVLLFSPSGARSLALRVDDPAAHPVWAVGPTTAAAARQLGFAVTGALSRPVPAALHEVLPS